MFKHNEMKKYCHQIFYGCNLQLLSFLTNPRQAFESVRGFSFVHHNTLDSSLNLYSNLKVCEIQPCLQFMLTNSWPIV